MTVTGAWRRLGRIDHHAAGALWNRVPLCDGSSRRPQASPLSVRTCRYMPLRAVTSSQVPNHIECAEWIGRTKQQTMYVVSTTHRPTPLRHYLYAAEDIWQVVDEDGQFDIGTYERAVKSQRQLEQRAKQEQRSKGGAKGGGKGGGAKGGGGKGGTPADGETREESGGGPTYHWSVVLETLQRRDLLPAVVFSFSKAKCEEISLKVRLLL